MTHATTSKAKVQCIYKCSRRSAVRLLAWGLRPVCILCPSMTCTASTASGLILHTVLIPEVLF